MVKADKTLWSEGELVTAVEAYVYMLRLETAGLSFATDAEASRLLAHSLQARNEASLRYRMRNISAVASELGAPTLRKFTPAERVGSNVRERIRTLLLGHPGFTQVLRDRSSGTGAANVHPGEAIERLSSIQHQLDDLERRIIGMGHNHPPEPLSQEGPQRADFSQAREDLERLKAEISVPAPNVDAIRARSGRLLLFGLKLSLWLGERATKFTDATLAVLAPVTVLHLLGFTQSLIDALKMIARIAAP